MARGPYVQFEYFNKISETRNRNRIPFFIWYIENILWNSKINHEREAN